MLLVYFTKEGYTVINMNIDILETDHDALLRA